MFLTGGGFFKTDLKWRFSAENRTKSVILITVGLPGGDEDICSHDKMGNSKRN